IMQEWSELGEISQETRRRLAAIAFQHTANYDTTIAEYLRNPAADYFPDELTLPLKRTQILRYGENPHQHAAFYRWANTSHLSASFSMPTVAGAEILHGKELSYNNLLDLDVALTAVSSFTAPAVVILK